MGNPDPTTPAPDHHLVTIARAQEHALVRVDAPSYRPPVEVQRIALSWRDEGYEAFFIADPTTGEVGLYRRTPTAQRNPHGLEVA